MEKMVKVMFVCHGNICRSPMAKFIFLDILKKNNRENDFIVDSSATSSEAIDEDIYYYAKRKLITENISVTLHKAKQFTIKDYNDFDYILIMDNLNYKNIMNIIKEDKFKKIYKLASFSGTEIDIADPWYTGNFNSVYEQIKKSCMDFYNYLNVNFNRGE